MSDVRQSLSYTTNVAAVQWRAKIFSGGSPINPQAAPVIPSSFAYLSSEYGIGGCREAGFAQTKSLEAKNRKPLQVECMRGLYPRNFSLEKQQKGQLGLKRARAKVEEGAH
jgi:hypothetical protein